MRMFISYFYLYKFHIITRAAFHQWNLTAVRRDVSSSNEVDGTANRTIEQLDSRAATVRLIGYSAVRVSDYRNDEISNRIKALPLKACILSSLVDHSWVKCRSFRVRERFSKCIGLNVGARLK